MNIKGIKEPVLNLASFDFLCMGQDERVKEAARNALEFYGCGSCGPRGFYGTIDKHLDFEIAISSFMKTQVFVNSVNSPIKGLLIRIFLKYSNRYPIQMVHLLSLHPFPPLLRRETC